MRRVGERNRSTHGSGLTQYSAIGTEKSFSSHLLLMFALLMIRWFRPGPEDPGFQRKPGFSGPGRNHLIISNANINSA